MYYLYRHTRNDTRTPFYIGVGTKPKKYGGFRTEFKRAFYTCAGRRSVFWYNVFNQCRGDISIDILYETNDREEIFSKEMEFIALYGRRDTGYGTLVNLSDGGEGNNGNIHSESTKAILSRANKGRKHSAETIEKIKKNHASKNPLYYRKPASKETRKKLSNAFTGTYLLKDVTCIETCKTYPSVRDMCNDMFDGKGATKVLQCLSDKYCNLSYRGYHFALGTSCDADIKHPSYFIKIRCVETGGEFMTMTECAVAMFGDKKYKSGISKAVKTGKDFRGYTFSKVD